jgi:beta-mannosidase
MLLHQKSGTGNQLIREYMLRDYPAPKDFPAFLHLGQVLQAEGIKRAVENLRRSRPRTMGSLYWQLDDCWPVASWSSIDYFGRWKALHYYARRFYGEILVSPRREQEVVEVYVVSDRREAVDAELHLRVLGFDGRVVGERRAQVRVAPLASAVHARLPLRDLLGDADPRTTYLEVALLDGRELLSSNSLFFAPARDLALGKPALKVEVSSDGPRFRIGVSSDRLARHVALAFDEVDGFFSDNYFDIAPGGRAVLSYTPEAPVDLAALRAGLRVVSLADDFQ